MSDSPLPPDVQDLVTRLFTMARTGDNTLLEYVREGVDVNLTNQDGNTLLMLAAYNGHAELVRGLAELGADANRLNLRGQAPLAGAIFKKEDAVVEALLDAGADVNAGTPSPVDTARMFQREDLVARFGKIAQ